MGWCSGTTIFDKAAAVVLTTHVEGGEKFNILYALAKALEHEDWDCQSDSLFIDHPIVKDVMEALKHQSIKQ